MTKIVVLGVALLLALPLGAFGAPGDPPVGRWTPLGPWGATIFSLAADPADPDRFYAGTPRGLFVSTDQMATWHLLGSLPGRPTVGAIFVDPSDPARIVAAVNATLLGSTDRGATWTSSSIDQPIPSLLPEVNCLVGDPTHPAILYACSGITFGQGILKSTDGGSHFSTVSPDLDSANVAAIVVDPASPSTLYAAVPGNREPALPGPIGVVKSLDGGATWQARNAGLPGTAVQEVVRAPQTGALYAVLSSGKVFQSLDGAAGWAALPVATPPASSLAAAPDGALYLGGARGIFRSANGGATWTATPERAAATLLGVGLGGPAAAAVYAAGSGGVLRSADSGRTWPLSKTGLTELASDPLAVDPQTSELWITADHTYRSPGGGSAFHRLGRDVRSLAIDPTDSTRLYGILPSGRLVRSLDRGASWDVLPLPSACVFLTTIAVAPSQPQILYAGGSPLAGSGPGHDPDPACIARCQAFRSQDGGDSWSCLPLDTVDAFIVDPAAAGTLYALNAGTTGNLYDLILKSTDGGLTWQDASHGLGSLGDSGFLEVRTLAIDPSHSGHLFTIVGLFGTSLLFTSTDGGLSWSPSGLPLPSLTSAGTTVLSLVLDPRRPLVLYAGLLEGGILRTSDLGTTWTALTSGLPPIDTSGSLVADPQNPSILYAGTVGSGIYRIQLR